MPTKPKKTPPPAKPPAPAPAKKKTQIDPKIAELRKKHHEEVQEYMKSRSSENKLNRILKLLTEMTRADQKKLYDHLKLTAVTLNEAAQEEAPAEKHPDQVIAKAGRGWTLTEEPAGEANPWPTAE